VRHRRRGGKVAELLELQRSQELREQKWKDYLGHLRQVEHALLDISSALPSTSRESMDDRKTVQVCTSIPFLSDCPVVQWLGLSYWSNGNVSDCHIGPMVRVITLVQW